MHFSPFNSVLVRRWVLLLSVGIGCSSSWSQAEHHQAAASVDSKVASVPAQSASKPAVRKPRPQLAVGTAFAPDGSLWLVGLNAESQLFVQSALPPKEGGSHQWSAPRIIDTGGDAISADGENHPKLAFGPKGWVVISYSKPLATRFTALVRMLRSTDGGSTFSAPVTLHTDLQEIAHSFDSIVFDAKGALHAVWLDKRDGERAPKLGDKSTYRGSAVYRKVSLDGGATFGADLRVADHSCECCRIAVAQGTDGRAYAMWRHVFEPNVRDHAFAALDAGGAGAPTDAQPMRATFDNWRVDGCPHHGPGLSATAQGGFHTVWFGIRKQGDADVAGVRYARLNANGSPVLDSARALPDARAEHADVLAVGERVAVVWRSTDGARSSAKAWLSSDGGRNFREQLLGEVNGPNDYPRLLQHAGKFVVVWRNEKEVKVHGIPF